MVATGSILRRALALATFLLPPTLAPASAQEPVWPLSNGTHEVLHSFQNPFAFFLYFHEGVDLRGSLDDVVAVRSGTVRYVNQGDAGGSLVVEVQTSGGVEADSYLHVILDPWLVNDTIQAGDRVGVVQDSYFSTPLQDHVHVNRFDGYAGGNGYVTGRTNMIHPLALFATDPERDPQQNAAGPHDANEDGRVFHVAPNNQPTTVLPYAYRSVELVLEADDRLSSSLYWNQGLMGIGYWVEALSGGEDVASALTPYRLLRFDDAWRASAADCDLLVDDVMVTGTTWQVRQGPDTTGWTMYAAYRLTETSGFQGLASAISNTQAWVTDARIGSGSGNGTGAVLAREISEARFPDGRVRVHALCEDLVSQSESTHEVVVDNFRPYLRSLRVVDAGTATELFRSAWSFDAPSSTLSFRRAFSVPGDFALVPGDTITLELEFSEPMASTSFELQPAIGTLPPLSSTQAPDQRTVWSTTFVLDHYPRSRHLARARVAGTDLAGTTLFPFVDTAARTAPFNKRVNANPITDPTEDRVHVVPLARRRATTRDP